MSEDPATVRQRALSGRHTSKSIGSDGIQLSEKKSKRKTSTFVAKHDFKARGPGERSLSKGDVILGQENGDSGWVRDEKTGEHVPADYLEEVEEEARLNRAASEIFAASNLPREASTIAPDQDGTEEAELEGGWHRRVRLMVEKWGEKADISLKDEDYQGHSTDLASKNTVDVSTSVQIQYIANVDTVSQSFEVGFYLNFEWKPSKLDVEYLRGKKIKHIYESQEKGGVTPGDVFEYKKAKAEFQPSFIPSFTFPNALEFKRFENVKFSDGSTFALLRHGHDDPRGGEVNLRKSDEEGEEGALRFDVQDLRIIIVCDPTVKKQRLVPPFRRGTIATVSTGMSNLPEWELHAPMCVFSLSDPGTSSRLIPYSSVTLFLKVQRRWWSIIIRMVTLIFTLGCSMLSVFAFPPHDLSSRLSTAFTLVLSALVFMFVVEARLPKVPYLTLLDYYVYWTFFIMMGVTACCVVVATPQLISEDQRDEIDTWVAYSGAGALGLLQLWFIVRGAYFNSIERRKLDGFKHDRSKPLKVKKEMERIHRIEKDRHEQKHEQREQREDRKKYRFMPSLRSELRARALEREEVVEARKNYEKPPFVWRDQKVFKGKIRGAYKAGKNLSCSGHDFSSSSHVQYSKLKPKNTSNA